MRLPHPARVLSALALLAWLLPHQLPATAALLPPTTLPPPTAWHYLTPADHAQLRALVAADLRRPQPTADGYTAQLVEQRLLAHFTPAGLTVTPTAGGSWRWAIAAVGIGRDDTLQALDPTAPVAEASLVRYPRAGVEEWYRLDAAGVEQGFTVPAPPAGSGPLRLVLRVESPLVGQATSARDAVWRDAAGAERLAYRGLRAWDAAGRELAAWLEVLGDALALRVDDAGAVYPLAIDPLVQQAKLTASDGAANDQLGNSVALSSDGNTALVGAVFADIGSNTDQGAAYVFVRSGSTWAQQAKLTASDGAANDQFGFSVALSSDGNTALVGAWLADIGSNTDQGAAYVFAATPTPTATRTPTPTATASPSPTSTPLPSPTSTASPTATPTPSPTASCASVGAVCHTTLAPGGPAGLLLSGPLAPGPCSPPAAPNCVQTTSTGSFTVQGTLAGLPVGAQAVLSLPVVSAQGALLGARAVLCPPAGATGSVACSGAVAEPGVFPQLGGLVGLRLLAASPTPTAPPPPAGVLAPPVPPPPLLPPPAPLPAPAPPPPLAMPPVGAEVPVVPEADSWALLALGGVGLALGWALRRR